MKKPTLVSNRLRRPGESLAARAYQQIRDEILRGDLAIGDVLSRRKLADRLNMSFLPITEAMQRLESEGLVESRPRIGTRVRIPTEQDIRNSYVIREALESQAARLCAEHITAADKKQLLPVPGTSITSIRCQVRRLKTQDFCFQCTPITCNSTCGLQNWDNVRA